MCHVENPQRQLRYLEQCLSNDKKPLGLFLGAGCPMAVEGAEPGEPLIPDIAGLTGNVHGRLIEDERCGALIGIVDDHFRLDGRTNANIEDTLSHVRALRAVAGAEKVRNLSASDLETLDDGICDIICEIMGKKLGSKDTPYHAVAAWIDGIVRDKPIEVFTTNYDLLMEQALEDQRVPYFDGFAGTRKPFFDIRTMESEDALPPRWARL